MQALTVREACERLRISRTTFYEHVKRGIGPRITKIGTRSVVFEETIWPPGWSRDHACAGIHLGR